MSQLLEILKTLRDLETLESMGSGPTAGIVGLDWRVCPVDATGVALGTAGNPIATTVGTVSGTQNIQGAQANGSTITENPVLIGQLHSDNTVRLIGNAPTNVNASGTNLLAASHVSVAVAHGANPSAVTAGNYQTTYMNRHAIPFMIGGHPNVQTYAANYTGAQADLAIVTVSTGTKIVVTGFLITCHNANSVNVAARLGFGTAVVPAYPNAQIIGSHPGIAAGSGFGRGGGSGIIGVGADNEDLRLTISVPTGGSCDINCSYYTIET